jgi:hypothetical protein
MRYPSVFQITRPVALIESLKAKNGLSARRTESKNLFMIFEAEGRGMRGGPFAGWY